MTIAVGVKAIRKPELEPIDVMLLFPIAMMLGLARSQWKRSQDRETAFVTVRVRPDDPEEDKVTFDVLTLIIAVAAVGATVYGQLAA